MKLKIASQTVIVLTSPRVIQDFMDRRSASTSDRPAMKLVDLITDGLNPALARNGLSHGSILLALHY